MERRYYYGIFAAASSRTNVTFCSAVDYYSIVKFRSKNGIAKIRRLFAPFVTRVIVPDIIRILGHPDWLSYRPLSCLFGSARSILKPIPLSSTNYNITGSAHTERFDNQRFFASDHVDKHFSFQLIHKNCLLYCRPS